MRRVAEYTVGWEPTPGGGRYRDIGRVDLDAARKAVCAWLDEHPDGTLALMAEELKTRYPEYPEEMAVVLRGIMAAELRRRTSPEVPAVIAGVPR